MIDKIQVGETTYDIKDTSVPDEVRNITSSDIENWNKNEIYSTEEQKIGIWINGKPLYRKTFERTSLTDITTYTVEILNDIDYINIIRACAVTEGSNRYCIPFSTYTTSTDYQKFYIKKKPDNSAEIFRGGSSLSGDLYVTVEYTKTTD